MIFNTYPAKLFRLLSFLLVFTFSVQPLAAQAKKRGKVTVKYANGVKESSGKVKNFKKQGTWKYWTDDGVLSKTVTYKDDVREGVYTEYYAGGQKKSEGNYLHNAKNGEWKAWYNDGKLASVLNYNATLGEGRYDGVQQWWYPNGQMRERRTHANDKVVQDEMWYDNGKLRSTEYYKDGKQEGTWRTYPAPGESTDTLPSTVKTYKNGKKEGVHLAYKNGRLSQEVYFKNDMRNGTYKVWDKNSQLGVSENYVDDNRDGVCQYFNYGKLIREVTYEKGRINGEEKEYDGRGEVFRISWYKQGMIDSTYHYHRNGRLAISRTYKYYPGFAYTEEFSNYTEWDTAGVLILRGTYHFEKKDKDWTTYYRDGKVKSITPWSSGKIKGIYTKWYANGKKMIEMECDGNTVAAQPKVWDEKGKVIKPGTNAYNEIVDSSKPGEVYNDPRKYKENRRDEMAVPQVKETRFPPAGDFQEMEGVVATDAVMGDVFAPVAEEPQEDPVFTFAEEMPEFPGGNDSMKAFIQRNIKYPAISMEEGQQGTVYIGFVVEKDGTVSNVKVRKEIRSAPALTAEAIRVVKLFPKYKPGKMNGRPVRCEMTIPVRFVLQ